MPVTSGDFRFYKSAVVSDVSSTNGGGISSNLITGGAANAIFANLSSDELASSGSRWRKIFAKNINASNLGLMNAAAYIKRLTPADDYLRIVAGTDSDVQSAAAGYSGLAGAGELSTSATAGDSSIEVEYDAADGVADGDEIRISDGTNTEYATVSGGPSWVGSVATLTLAAGIANNFTAGETVVSTLVDLGDIKPSYSGWAGSFAGTGDFDDTQIGLYNVGTVVDTWTGTFSSPTNFSVTGAASGNVGTGLISVDFRPANGGSYYFKLPAAAWSGSPQAGDSFQFSTVHSAKSIWLKNIWTGGISSYSGNNPAIEIKGESE